MPKLPDTQRRILTEMTLGTELRRVQSHPGAKVKYLLGDKTVQEGPVASVAMAGYVTPVDRIELSAPKIRYEITEKGRAALAKATT